MEPDREAHPLAPEPELLAGPGRPFGLYLHVPYCRAKCPYCDFNVAIYRADRVGPFLEALGAELARHAALPWAGRVPAVSLFLGGGTPSLLPPDGIAALIAAARRDLGLAAGAEVTLEANPDGLDAGWLRAAAAAGVTRLSLGVQALDDDLLRRLGRTHSAAQARRAWEAARAAGFASLSLDLLYGCPGQTVAAWRDTLDEALGWSPEHLSAYALTLEARTPFGRRPPPGLPDEEAQVAQFELLCDRAAGAGLARYEISNFARPGFRSRHNLLYWSRADYLGLGPGAHGGLGPLRYANERSQTRWRAAVLASRWPIERLERLSPRQVAAERIVLGLRLAEGVPREWIERHLGEAGGADRALARYLDAGVLAERAGRLALTDRGVLVSDTVFAELV
ncbi:MAG TPA: radical SAM family heme chaperone HemW [Methylomirabilota bacterium]|nr:radical SAM family heme chaperone HemW [Methylomirabilota bacterium]